MIACPCRSAFSFVTHPENYCWILVITLIVEQINWLKYLGRNRRSYWYGALQLRLWKHDHVRPGSLTFWLIYEVSKLLTIFITDHISPHTQATLACNRPEDSMPCDQVQIHCAGQFNVWQKQLRRIASTTRSSTERSKWRRRREDPETSRHVSLSLDLFKYESAGHSGTLRSSETRPTISTRANKSRRFKCWHLLDSKRRSDIWDYHSIDDQNISETASAAFPTREESLVFGPQLPQGGLGRATGTQQRQGLNTNSRVQQQGLNSRVVQGRPGGRGLAGRRQDG